MDDVLDKPTTSPISTRKHGDVLIVLSNNPPVNALGAAVRQGLVAAIEEAEADDSVKAVVIACEGQTFFAGADITEFGKPPVMPWLPSVVDTIENCSQAGGRGDPRDGAGRRARGRARLPLSRGGAERQARHARSQAGPAARARAGPSACRGWPASSRRWRCAQPAIRFRAKAGVRLRAGRPADRGRADPARGRICRGSARCAAAAQSVRAAGPAATSVEPGGVRRIPKANARKFRGFEAPRRTSKR